MTRISIGTLDIAIADIGAASPHAPLRPITELHNSTDLGDDIPETIRIGVDYGRVETILPYHAHDSYQRTSTARALPLAIIENDRLRAAFLTSFGGRMWSLFDKASQRELLYQSPVIQPANIGLANAWFAGGVEWNISTIGHSPLSVEPIHVVSVKTDASGSALRLYGYERLRGTPYQIDIMLPDGSPVLFVGVRVRNPNPEAVPLYWWSNIAIPESVGSRVIVPADHAFRFGYEGGLDRVGFPEVSGIDASFPMQGPESVDFFFDLAPTLRPWIAAVDADGRGLFQMSTQEMRGRKLFIWGQRAGGHRWQSFLSDGAHPYFEIQAGIAETQLQHVPLPAGRSTTWLEAYGAIDLDVSTAHGTWPAAREAAAAWIDRIVPETALEAARSRWQDVIDAPGNEVLAHGTGWGALEDRRRRLAGELPISSPATPFASDALGPDVAPWLELLERGAFPVSDPGSEPPLSVIGKDWQARLEAAPRTWVSLYLLGVVVFADGDRDRARTTWEESLREVANPWALRALALIDRSRGPEAAATRLEQAVAMRPADRTLLVELVEALLLAGRGQEAIARIEQHGAPSNDGRIRLLEAQAAIALDDPDRALGILLGGLVVADLREGDTILEDIWNDVQARLLARREDLPLDQRLRARAQRGHPIPADLDFRMAGNR